MYDVNIFGLVALLFHLSLWGFGIYFFVTILLSMKKRNEILMSIRDELRKSNEQVVHRFSERNEKVDEG